MKTITANFGIRQAPLFVKPYRADPETTKKIQNRTTKWLHFRISRLIYDIYKLRYRYHVRFSKGDFEIYEAIVLIQLEEQFGSNIEDAVSRNQPLSKKLKLYDEASQRREQENMYLEERMYELDRMRDHILKVRENKARDKSCTRDSTVDYDRDDERDCSDSA